MEADGNVTQTMNFILTAELLFREQIIKAYLLTCEGSSELMDRWEDETDRQNYIFHIHVENNPERTWKKREARMNTLT